MYKNKFKKAFCSKTNITIYNEKKYLLHIPPFLHLHSNLEPFHTTQLNT